METQVVSYKDYVISAEEGVERGIFFRSPIQKVYFDAYYDAPKFSAWEYLAKIKNPIRRLYEILIGNRKILSFINELEDRYELAGFRGNILCSPIYFKRKYRKLSGVALSDANIQKIESYGYESEFNDCSGACHIEKTKIHLKTGKITRIKRHRYYKYTYVHIIEEMIDTGYIMSD